MAKPLPPLKIPTPHTLSDILAIKKSEKSVLWGPITRKSITLLYGATGVGKSFFILGLLYALAAGLKFCGYITQGNPKILTLDGELDLEDTAIRLRMITPESEMNIGCDSINILTREDFGTGLVPNISLPENQVMYTRIFEPYDVIVIDNLNTTSYPKNDRDGEISQFLRVLPWLLQLRDQGKAIILVHHTNKAGEQMGSILKEQIATNVLELQKVQGDFDSLKFKMIWKKHRHVSRSEAKPMVVEAVQSSTGMSWLIEDPTVDLEQRVVQLAKEGLKQREIAEQIDLDVFEISRIIKKNKHNSFNGKGCSDEF